MALSVFGAPTSGIRAQQLDMDLVANNLANMNTPGFQASRMDFQDLIYGQQSLIDQVNGSQQIGAPYAVRVGDGVQPETVSRVLNQGTLMADNDPLHVAVNGEGYFTVAMPDGTAAFTRDGAFSLDSSRRLVTADGNYVIPYVTIPANVTNVAISPDGLIYGQVGTNTTTTQIGEIQLARFNNPGGLVSIGHNLLQATPESGNAVMTVPGTNGSGALVDGNLEGSNVDVATEMTSMMMAERAYQMNMHSIQTFDQMLNLANTLRG